MSDWDAIGYFWLCFGGAAFMMLGAIIVLCNLWSNRDDKDI